MIARIHHTVPRIHRADNIGRTRLINVRPAEPVHIVDQCHGDIAPLRHLPVPLRAALRDITRKGIAHRHAHRLPVRVQADGIGVCAAVRRIAHLRHPQRVQYRAHGGVVAHVGRPQGVQLLRVQRIAALVLRRLRQQTRADDDRRDRHHDRRPYRRLLIAQHVLHPFFHRHLAEGQRAHRRHFRLGGAGHQRPGIGRPLRRICVIQRHLVTGVLHVPPQQDIGRPQHRVEPVHRQQQERKGLHHVIPPPDVAPLVGQHLGQILLRHALRHIDARRDNAQHKGRAPLGAAVHVVPNVLRSPQRQPHPDKAQQHIRRHAAHADDPYPRQPPGERPQRHRLRRRFRRYDRSGGAGGFRRRGSRLLRDACPRLLHGVVRPAHRRFLCL